MNSELQAQTDAMIKAINAASTTAHQDALIIAAGIVALVIVLIIVALFKKGG